ncbi:MAG: hypothetical protein ACOC6C_01515, partial [Verrucomicrobiota bacterium]
MMKKNLFVLPLIIAGCVGASAAFAEQRVAVVDMEKIMEASPDVDRVEDFVEKQEMDLKSEREEMIDKRNKLMAEFEEAKNDARNQALSEKGRSQKVEEAEEKLAEL